MNEVWQGGVIILSYLLAYWGNPFAAVTLALFGMAMLAPLFTIASAAPCH